MTKLFILILLTCSFIVTANAQKARMSSVYTNLPTDCKAETKSDGDEVPFICKAVGGFRVRIVPAGAWAETVEIVNAKGKTVVNIATVGYGYTNTDKRKLEWRLANGKPFAVIFRVNTYDSEKAIEDGNNPFLAKYKTGEKLILRGLTGYSQIEFEVDGKEKNANAKAQNLADVNFQ